MDHQILAAALVLSVNALSFGVYLRSKVDIAKLPLFVFGMTTMMSVLAIGVIAADYGVVMLGALGVLLSLTLWRRFGHHNKYEGENS
ncbi:MAG: hypothetical protein AAF250_08940 [Pseudomonadota bacterium]